MAWDALATLVTGILGFLLDYAVHRRERIAAYQASIFEAELSAYKELWEFGFLCCKKVFPNAVCKWDRGEWATPCMS